MITASDARALGAVSNDKANNYLRVYVEPKITAAARVGKSSVFYMVGSRSMWQVVAITPHHRAIITRLQALGYAATWQNSYGEFYTPSVMVTNRPYQLWYSNQLGEVNVCGEEDARNLCNCNCQRFLVGAPSLYPNSV